MRVMVVYASQTGRTERMARAFAEGAGEAGAEVVLRRAEDASPEELLDADAIAVGSGVHMSGMEPAMSRFMESTSGRARVVAW